ncbi:LytR C-terminal domain-containing protein [Amycolatopsis saalfeldensis]|uniref:LytR cell envelope-related transcriptional attenuator n=1 Tax=Amycolatopsis saalfeldensis TaxID=394193 RepID=A0A1H8WII2_9PSEU|nr:LytR C-terminal domain-containing protein [Amycolatopsis saalfeldensis]SEP26898.1 LytR cell envelope-related transcriptional attenuator [Amycolatopsis saalfeldensis]
MSFFSGLSRPLRAAAVALIGVAVVAAVIGGVTLATSGGSNDNTAGPSNSAGPSSPASSGAPSSAPGSSSAPPSSPSAPPSSSAAPGSSSAVPPGGQPTGQPGQPGGQPGTDQQASNKWVTVRVYNNSLIKGLAEQAANDFRGAGWNVPEVGNYSQGVIDHTTAYFRPGTDEEAAAKQLATEFGFQAQPRFDGIQNSSPGVIVIITKDYQSGHKGS